MIMNYMTAAPRPHSDPPTQRPSPEWNRTRSGLFDSGLFARSVDAVADCVIKYTTDKSGEEDFVLPISEKERAEADCLEF